MSARPSEMPPDDGGDPLGDRTRGNGGPDRAKDRPDGESSNPEPSGCAPDMHSGGPDAADVNPESDARRSDAQGPAAPRDGASYQEFLEPSGWADAYPGAQSHFSVSGTDIETITIKTTAAKKERNPSGQKPKAPSTGPAGGGGDGDGDRVPPSGSANDEAPSTPDPRKKRLEITLPLIVHPAFTYAGEIARESIDDIAELNNLSNAIKCVAKYPKWRAIAAEALQNEASDIVIADSCQILQKLASERKEAAVDRAARFITELGRRPAAALAWFDAANDACLMALGNEVLRRGGFARWFLERRFPALAWTREAARRAKRDAEAEHKEAS